jgi:hypothetical protein
MNQRYWKFAGTVLCGAATLWTLSGCSTRSARTSDQTYTTTTSYASQPSAQANGSVAMSNQGAPVYGSDSQWQAGYVAPRQGRQMNEAAGADVQTQSTQTAPQHLAPVDSSSSQWQRAESPTVEASGNAYVQPSHREAHWRSDNRMQASGQWQASANSEGPNSGGKWQRGVGQETLGPAATAANGWLPGYYNPYVAQQQQGTIQEAAGSYNHNGHHWNGRESDLQQQLDRQQQEIERQQQELNRLQQQLNQRNQGAPSNNSTTP